MKEELKNTLLKNLIINDNQGYAFYFKHGEKKLEEVNGLKDINNSVSLIDYDTNFRLASVTKQFIAYGMLELIKMYDITLDTMVSDVIKSLPSYFNNITIKNLLNHTSGIMDYEDMPHSDSDPQIHDIDILSFLNTTNDTYFKVGSSYRYSNTAFILLGLIIEEVSKMKIDEYLNRYVFSKAGMNDTYVNYEGITSIPKRAYGHIIDNGKIILKDQYWCSATIGDGGIYSSVSDLKKWIKFLESNSDELNDTMFKSTIINGSDIYYGLGIRVINVNGKKVLYHCGDTIGTNTFIMFSKDLDLECVFLTNMGYIDTEILKENIVKYLNNNK